MIKFKSFRTKILFWYGVSLLIIISFFSIGLYLGIKLNFEKNLLKSLQSIANDVKNDDLKNRNYNELHFIEHKEEFPIANVYIQVTKEENNTQKVILKSRNLKDNILPIPNNLTLQSLEKIDNEKTILLSIKDKGVINYIIQVATPLDKIDDEVEKILSILFILDPILFIISLFIGYLLIKQTLLPVQIITKIARDISASDFSKRIPIIHSEDEFAKLAETFNNMIDRLEKSFENIKRFSSDASHELKTPLTIIRGEVEVALMNTRDENEYKKVLNSVLEEVISLQKIIENLFTLTKTDSNQIKSKFKKINLDYILLQVYEDFFQIAQKKGVIFDIKNITPIQINGEPNLIKILFVNLIDNAIKYTPKAKKITINLEKKDDLAIFSIEDEGIGISKEKLAFIFDRFYRVDNSRSKQIKGYGLGLSIVKKIIDLHNVKIDVSSNEEKGSEFNIFFKATIH